MEPSFVRRLFVGQTSVVLVLVLSTLTAVIALRGVIRQTEQTAAIDHRLALLDKLERDTRELAVSGRSQLLTGGAGECQGCCRTVSVSC